MTIRKGESWGAPATPPPDAIAVGTDRELSRSLEASRRAGMPFPAYIVGGGDLGRTLAASDPPRNRFTIDVGEALLDGRHRYFVSHVVAQPGRGYRRLVSVMNAQWYQGWNLGPKGHPNDGRLDVAEFALQRFEWRKVRARLHSGTHVPHPRIETTRTAAKSFAFDAPTSVLLDGEPQGRATTLAVRVLPDALTVYA